MRFFTRKPVPKTPEEQMAADLKESMKLVKDFVKSARKHRPSNPVALSALVSLYSLTIEEWTPDPAMRRLLLESTFERIKLVLNVTDDPKGGAYQ